jgi:hypothetical protein
MVIRLLILTLFVVIIAEKLTTIQAADTVQVFKDLVVSFDTTIVDGVDKNGIKYYAQGQRMEKR